MKSPIFHSSPGRARRAGRRGFTLMEVLIVVAIISTLAGFGFVSATALRGGTTDIKLTRDVAVLNQALKQYQLFGGSLAGVNDAQVVIDKLKTKMTGDNRKQMAGLRGSLVDSRMKIALQTSAEAAQNKPRALYIPGEAQFIIVTSGSAGIRAFELDEALATQDFGTETRNNALKLAVTEKWVWDFTDTRPTSASGPSQITASGIVAQTTPPDSTLATLTEPTFSLNSGTYPLTDYPQTVTLMDTNPPNRAEVQYSINGSPFVAYRGGFKVDPGDVVSAFASPLDADHFESSGTPVRDYRTTPIVPTLQLRFSGTDVTYADLGGPLLPAAVPGAPKEGSLSLTNAGLIPDFYENSNTFMPAWTFDGADPRFAATAVLSSPFNNGYPGNQIPMALASWPAGSASRTVSAAIRTLRPAIIQNSAIATATLNRRIVSLPEPDITFDGRDAILTLDTVNNVVPAGARIFYTLDDSDPSDNSGEPVSGTLYSGPIALDGDTGFKMKITARTYPPAAYKEWFTTSKKATAKYELPIAVAVYVGGDFHQTGTGSAEFRNLARLKGDGSVDPRFNTGSGASSSSMVGVIRQIGGGVLAGGDFETVNGAARPGLVRLQTNGSVDLSFNAGLAGGK